MKIIEVDVFAYIIANLFDNYILQRQGRYDYFLANYYLIQLSLGRIIAWV